MWFVLFLPLSGFNIRKGNKANNQQDLFSKLLSLSFCFRWSSVYLWCKVCSSLRKDDLYVTLILLKLCKNAVFMTLRAQKLASNYIFLCVRWKKNLFWRYKLWLSWKQCVILAWRFHTWVAQTCESVKQTTRIASAVTIWERSWTLSIFYSLKRGHMVEPPFCWCKPQTGLSGSTFSRLQLKDEETLSQLNQEQEYAAFWTMDRYCSHANH